MTARLLSLLEVADILGVAKQTLYNWRSQRKGPPALKIGRLVKYRDEDLERWISDRAESS